MRSVLRTMIAVGLYSFSLWLFRDVGGWGTSYAVGAAVILAFDFLEATE